MLVRLVVTILAIFLCTIPSIAGAWTINATAGTGGTINPKGIISVAGTTGTSQAFSVAPASGYKVSRVTIDGNPQVIPAPDAGGKYPFTVGYNGVSYRSIAATFAVQTYKLTPTSTYATGANGWITTTTIPAGQQLDRLSSGTTATCVVTAAAGSQIQSILVNGVAQALTGASTQSVTLTMTRDYTVAARFIVKPTVTANAGSDLKALGNGPDWPVTLTGSGTTNTGTALSYSWVVTAGPTGGVGVLGTPGAASSTFYALVPGVYTVRLTVTDGTGASATDTATVTVPWRSEVETDYCLSCHTSRDPEIAAVYPTSKHATTGPEYTASCYECHNPDKSGSHYTLSAPTGVCEPCHSGATAQIVADFHESPHPAAGLVCVTCHNAHAFAASFSICATCHNNTTAPVPNTAIHAGLGLDVCNLCHNNHKATATLPGAHYNNITTGAYPASWVTKNSTCSNCHTDFSDPVNKAARQDWAKSGKSAADSPAWTLYDFKMRGSSLPANQATNPPADDCVRCHTTTGFLNYVTDSDGRGTYVNVSAWGTSTDKTKETLACNACHVIPFDSSNSRRRVGRETSDEFGSFFNVVTWYSYSTAGGKDRIARKFVADKEDSNICITCHTGKVIGENIKNLAGKINWANTPFINPHYMAAATTLFQGQPGDKIAGYEYRHSSSYLHITAHAGLDSSQGPCVKCHMSTSRKHTFSPYSTAADGFVTPVPTCFGENTVGGCHNTNLDNTFIQGRKQGFLASLDVIAALLAAQKQIYYNPGKYPYFFTGTDYVTPTTNWGDVNTMGAAFNLKLFSSERGAWTHAPKETQQVIYDTIDFLDDGLQNDTVHTALFHPAVEPVVRVKAQGYVNERIRE